MNRQFVFIGIIFLLSLLCWRWFDDSHNVTPLTDPRQLFQPNFTATHLTYLNFAENGQLRNEVTASYTEYYDQLEQSELYNPVITTYDNQNGEAQWRLSAKQGVLNINDNAILRDQVHLQALSPNNTLETLDTAYLELDLTRNEVRNNHAVTLKGPQLTLSGVGLRGQLDQRIFQLLDESHGIYLNQP